MPWDQLGKRGQEKSRKALISLGFTAFLGLPGKTNWWSRGNLNHRLYSDDWNSRNHREKVLEAYSASIVLSRSLSRMFSATPFIPE